MLFADVRLQKLLSSKQGLESEVRKLKLQLNDERAARQNGVANHHDQEIETERESTTISTNETIPTSHFYHCDSCAARIYS